MQRNNSASTPTPARSSDTVELDDLAVLMRLILDIEEVSNLAEPDLDEIREKCRRSLEILRSKTAPTMNEQIKKTVFYLQHAAKDIKWDSENTLAKSYLEEIHLTLTGHKLFAGAAQ